jgi:diguanylate cyclase (GGDEF)-like protein
MVNWLDRLPLQLKLRLVVVVLSLGMLVAAIVGGWALARTRSVMHDVVQTTSALSLLQSVDMLHDELRSEVFASLLVGQVASIDAEKLRGEVKESAFTMRETMTRLGAMDLGPLDRAELLASRKLVDRYVETVEAVISMSPADKRRQEQALVTFNAAFDELRIELFKRTESLRRQSTVATEEAEILKTNANLAVAATGLATLALMALLVQWVSAAIRRSLQHVQSTAAAVAGGDLDRRANVATDDEISHLAGSVNSMADKLQDMLSQALRESEQHSFTSKLADALEMADSEPAAYAVIQRAMAAVAPDRPMELLVSDSSQAVLQRATEHPSAGAPGCGVDSPFSCQAVRRGNTVKFPDSEAINACPKLRGRPGRPGSTGSVSAVCVPLHFMGRALGVLHSLGPVNDTQLSQLGALGDQAAARIGVVRAFERTQLQAATDSGTGLANRRSLEAAIHELVRKAQPFALVMADLDRFKMLNDTYGHLVGDEALRLFADTMKKAVREHDLVARWGGEEFAFILSGSTARHAFDWADRARELLAGALEGSHVPNFTVSFGVSDSTMGERLDDLLRIADEALYRSKEQGRNRVTLGSPVAANEPRLRQASEHEAKIDPARLNAG